MATTLRPRPAALNLTPSAHARIADLMAKAPEGAVGVKLSTPRRGCSGLAYSVDYVTDVVPFDERIDTPGGTLFVDGGSILYLIGSTMDWVEDDFAAGFVFQNPNSKGECGLRGIFYRLAFADPVFEIVSPFRSGPASGPR